MSESELQRLPIDAPWWRVLLFEARQYGIAAVVAIAIGAFTYILYKDQQAERQEKDRVIAAQTDRLFDAFDSNTKALEATANGQEKIAEAVEALTTELKHKTQRSP